MGGQEWHVELNERSGWVTVNMGKGRKQRRVPVHFGCIDPVHFSPTNEIPHDRQR